MKKKILVPVDFSECSKNALLNAIKMAQQWDLKLHLVHSYLIPAEVFATSNSTNSFFDLVNYTDIDASFSKLVNQEMPELKSVEYQCSLKQGRLYSVINDYAENEDIELVVMGTHGANGVKELIIGSNAYNVIKETRLPVMIFPEKSGVVNLQRFVFLTGYKKFEDPEEFNPLRKLVERTNAEVDIIHFTKKGELGAEMIRKNKIKLYIGNINRSVHISPDALLERDIHDYVLLFDIDLLIMIPKKHNYFEALFGKETWSQKMVYHIDTPIFVLPNK